ncbi:MAG: acyl-ACP--UDP-N-acetylglucosamine O-acyltransferase [Gammaproteobacteria bacterium]|nr:acyl-ACP--UDP-N-acetylglucosamine O-acyltransferase [Gammaproteobacteria bacterium]
MIDVAARIHPGARLAEGVCIGPWTSVGEGVEIGPNSIIGAHCVLTGPTRIGADNRIYPFCSIGEDPQHAKYNPSVPVRLEIGDRNCFREYVSIHRGTPSGGGVTRIGNDNCIMAYCHIAHDCAVGNHTTFANNATLAGHVEIQDYAILAGFVGVHQFCRVGESSFSAIASVIVRDLPPYFIAEGNTARARAVNREGLKRRGFPPSAIAAIKQAFKTLYRQSLTLKGALEELTPLAQECSEVACLLDFIGKSKRGIVRGRAG